MFIISGPKTAPTTGQFTTGTLKKNVHSGSSDEDPYSLTPSGSSGSSGKGLRESSRSREESGSGARTRDSDGYGPQNWTNTNKGIPNDLSDDYVEVRSLLCFGPHFQVLGFVAPSPPGKMAHNLMTQPSPVNIQNISPL